MMARVEFKLATLRTQGTETTTEPPSPILPFTHLFSSIPHMPARLRLYRDSVFTSRHLSHATITCERMFHKPRTDLNLEFNFQNCSYDGQLSVVGGTRSQLPRLEWHIDMRVLKERHRTKPTDPERELTASCHKHTTTHRSSYTFSPLKQIGGSFTTYLFTQLINKGLHVLKIKNFRLIIKLTKCSISFIHSKNFYSASSSPLLLRGTPNYSIDTVSELTH